MKRFARIAGGILAAASISAALSCNMFTHELPCFFRGRWIAYDKTVEDSNIVTAVFDIDNKGNYKKTETNQNNSYTIVTEGKYAYSYYSLNYEKCTGSISFTPNEAAVNGVENYLFEVEMNAENGLVRLNLNNTDVRKKYELEYGGTEDIYIMPEEEPAAEEAEPETEETGRIIESAEGKIGE